MEVAVAVVAADDLGEEGMIMGMGVEGVEVEVEVEETVGE